MGGQGNLFLGFKEKSRLSRKSQKRQSRQEERFYKQDERKQLKRGKTDEQSER
jgi:hypothetical protein